MPDRLGALLDRSLRAYDDLVALGETVQDEWTYVNDLATAWRKHLHDRLDPRAEEAVSPALVQAIGEACTEASLVTDPHRAIDWLSTFPQVVLIAFGEAP
jgi:hypothetical protein